MEPRSTSRLLLSVILIACLASSALSIEVRAAQPNQEEKNTTNTLPANDTTPFTPHKPAEPQSDDAGSGTAQQTAPPTSAPAAEAEATCVGDPLCGNDVSIQWYQVRMNGMVVVVGAAWS